LRQEIPELGLFFTEQLCLRHDGLAYKPCGEEFTLLPGETIKQARKTVLSESEQIDEGVTVVDDLATTTKDNLTTTLDQSMEAVRQRNLDVKKTNKINIGAKKIFGLLNLSASSDATIDFKSMIKNTNKSSSKIVEPKLMKLFVNLK